MIDEKVFSHTVTIATTFVQNGDIRIQNKIKVGSAPFDEIEELVLVLYSVLLNARKQIETSRDV